MIEKAGMHTPYFFLSYARSDPLAGNPEENPDHLVERFFTDLTNAVRSRAHGTKGAVSGFFDQKIPLGSDLKLFITQALSASQVLVPLYSVGYLTNSWPGREFAYFLRRVEQAGRANPVRRLVPVLWAPLAGVEDPPGLSEALASTGAEPDYAENGLRALLKLSSYHDQYRAVVNQLAEQIVNLAESDPIDPVEPSQVPDIEQVGSEFSPDAPFAVFDIEAAAPAGWAPFTGQEVPLAEHARQVAEQFGFDARVSPVRVVGDADGRNPGIIIINPAFVAEETGRTTLGLVARELPRWVMPVLVLDHPGDSRTQELAATARAILKAPELPADSARREARGVESLDEFVAIVPVLVAEAERQYLRYRTSRVPPPRTPGRPRLGRRKGVG